MGLGHHLDFARPQVDIGLIQSHTEQLLKSSFRTWHPGSVCSVYHSAPYYHYQVTFKKYFYFELDKDS